MPTTRNIPTLTVITALAVGILLAGSGGAFAKGAGNGSNNGGASAGGGHSNSVGAPKVGGNSNSAVHPPRRCLSNTCGISKTIDDAASNAYRKVKSLW